MLCGCLYVWLKSPSSWDRIRRALVASVMTCFQSLHSEIQNVMNRAHLCCFELVFSPPLDRPFLYNIIYLLPLHMEKKNAFLVVITQCCIVDLSSHYSKWINYYNLKEWNRWRNGKVSGIPRHKCQPDMGEQFWLKASFLASNECWCSCFLMQGWRSASFPSGVSEVEESGSINGGLQTLNLSLPLQFN